MEDLVQWLSEQLDYDETIARRAANREKGGARWAFADMQVRAGDGAPVARHTWVEEGEHIAEHDPERVLREIDAKRKLLILHRPVRRADFTESDGSPAGPLVVCHECDANTTDADWPDMPCWTLRFLAAPYADRAGYKENWRP